MKKTMSDFVKAVLAGICIGLGGSVFLALLPTNRIFGAVLFTVGLFTICTQGFNLFTGKACNLLYHKPSYLGTLAVIWLGNLVGVAIPALLMRLTRQGASFAEAAQSLTAVKNADSLLSLFVLGVLCNVLIYIAVDGFQNVPHELGKYLALFLGVTVFILAGTEHSIADMYYYAAAGELLSAQALLRIAVVTLGNMLGGILLPAGKLLLKKLDA